MATKRIAVDGSDTVMLELSAEEYVTIMRALARAHHHAWRVNASADEADIMRLIGSLAPGTTIYCDGPPGWVHETLTREWHPSTLGALHKMERD